MIAATDGTEAAASARGRPDGDRASQDLVAAGGLRDRDRSAQRGHLSAQQLHRPVGLVHVTGTVVVTYTKPGRRLHAAAAASALDVNGADHEPRLAGDLQRQRDRPQAGRRHRRQRHRPVRHPDHPPRRLHARLGHASECASLDGAWSTGIGNATWSTTSPAMRSARASARPRARSPTPAASASHRDRRVRRQRRRQLVDLARPLRHDGALLPAVIVYDETACRPSSSICAPTGRFDVLPPARRRRHGRRLRGARPRAQRRASRSRRCARSTPTALLPLQERVPRAAGPAASQPRAARRAHRRRRPVVLHHGAGRRRRLPALRAARGRDAPMRATPR